MLGGAVGAGMQERLGQGLVSAVTASGTFLLNGWLQGHLCNTQWSEKVLWCGRAPSGTSSGCAWFDIGNYSDDDDCNVMG